MSEDVDDKTGREAIDLVTKGHVDMQRQLGVAVPSHIFAEIFARAVVEKQVREHCERSEHPTAQSLGHLEDKDPTQAKSAIDRGEVGENTTVINRAVGTADFHAGRMKTLDPNHPMRVEKPSEDRLLRSRLDFLVTLPDWKEKIDKAKLEGEAMAKARLRRGAISSLKEVMSIIADYVIAVAEQSNNVFGDYRHPRSTPSAPLTFGPMS